MSISTITIGGIGYTAYASVAEADAYLAVDPTRAATWATKTTDERGALLVAATRRLDQLSYSGSKVSDSQANQWPRTGATCNGVALGSSDVPQELEDATALLAGSIALNPANAAAGSSGREIKRVTAGGGVGVEYFRSTSGVPLQDETVFALLRCLLSGAGGSVGFGCASGTGVSSSFGNLNGPDVNEGYS